MRNITCNEYELDWTPSSNTKVAFVRSESRAKDQKDTQSTRFVIAVNKTPLNCVVVVVFSEDDLVGRKGKEQRMNRVDFFEARKRRSRMIRCAPIEQATQQLDIYIVSPSIVLFVSFPWFTRNVMANALLCFACRSFQTFDKLRIRFDSIRFVRRVGVS